MASAQLVVGRQPQRRQLRDALHAAVEHGGSAALVSAPAGMGKTTLLRAFLGDVGTDAVVGWGTCREHDAVGFWPFLQAFDDLLAEVGIEAARSAAGAWAPVLSGLVPALAVDGASDGDIAPGRQRAAAELQLAVAAWLRALASDRPLVLVLDDLHWADASSLDLVEHLLSRPARAPLLLVGAYRTGELPSDRLQRVAVGGAGVVEVVVDGLDVGEVADLLAAEGGEDRRGDAAEVHARTGGHPLFVRELARLSPAARADGLPPAVATALGARLATADPTVRASLDVAAVLGARVLPDVVARVRELPVPTVVDQLDDAVAHGFLVHADTGGHAFAHDLVRETVLAGISASELGRTHAAITAALVQRADGAGDVEPGDVARHAALGLPHVAAELALTWAHRAALVARRRSALREAAQHLTRVRERAAAMGVALGRDEVLSCLVAEVDHLLRAGATEDARERLVVAQRLAVRPEHVADVALLAVRFGARFATRRDQLVALLEDAAAAVAGVDLDREARVTAALARELQHSVSHDRARAAEVSARALRLGQGSDDPATLVECLLARHDVLWTPGTGAERAEVARGIVAAAADTGDRDHLATGLLLEANGLLESADPAFRVPLERWFSLLEERDEIGDRYVVLTRRVALALLEGRLEQGWALMEEAAALGEQIMEPDARNVLLSQRVAHAHAEGSESVLRALARDAVAHWTGAPVHANAVAAGALARAGDLQGAAAALEEVRRAGGWRSDTSYLRAVFLPWLASAAAALGDESLCREILDEVTPLADACGVNGAVVAFAGPFAATAAIAAEGVGDTARAATLRRRAAQIAARLGAVPWLGVEASGGDASVRPSLHRAGRVWTVSWAGEEASVPHVKGMGDLAVLLGRPGVPVSAVELAAPGAGLAPEARLETVDHEALAAYRRRLDDLDAELDRARDHHDPGTVEKLEGEREALLAEVRRATGLGGRVRPDSRSRAERARKAVSARIRDAIGRLEPLLPEAAAHLDRSVRTGLQCVYEPPDGDAPGWVVTLGAD